MGNRNSSDGYLWDLRRIWHQNIWMLPRILFGEEVWHHPEAVGMLRNKTRIWWTSPENRPTVAGYSPTHDWNSTYLLATSISWRGFKVILAPLCFSLRTSEGCVSREFHSNLLHTCCICAVAPQSVWLKCWEPPSSLTDNPSCSLPRSHLTPPRNSTPQRHEPGITRCPCQMQIPPFWEATFLRLLWKLLIVIDSSRYSRLAYSKNGSSNLGPFWKNESRIGRGPIRGFHPGEKGISNW